MLQQDQPDDYVLATGEMHSVREFVERAFAHVGRPVAWRGQGVDEVGYDIETGSPRVCIDPRYFRPTEVEQLLGDASRKEVDLVRQEAVERWMREARPDGVFLAADKVGGIWLTTRSRPNSFDNLMIEANIIHSAFETKVTKLVFLGSSCIYPRRASRWAGLNPRAAPDNRRENANVSFITSISHHHRRRALWDLHRGTFASPWRQLSYIRKANEHVAL